jgi:hypothetical protein
MTSSGTLAAMQIEIAYCKCSKAGFISHSASSLEAGGFPSQVSGTALAASILAMRFSTAGLQEGLGSSS